MYIYVYVGMHLSIYYGSLFGTVGAGEDDFYDADMDDLDQQFVDNRRLRHLPNASHRGLHHMYMYLYICIYMYIWFVFIAIMETSEFLLVTPFFDTYHIILQVCAATPQSPAELLLYIIGLRFNCIPTFQFLL